MWGTGTGAHRVAAEPTEIELLRNEVQSLGTHVGQLVADRAELVGALALVARRQAELADMGAEVLGKLDQVLDLQRAQGRHVDQLTAAVMTQGTRIDQLSTEIMAMRRGAWPAP